MTSRAPTRPLALAGRLRSALGSIACRGLYRDGMEWIGKQSRERLRDRLEAVRASRRPRVPVAGRHPAVAAPIGEELASRIQGMRASIREAEHFLTEGEDAP